MGAEGQGASGRVAVVTGGSSGGIGQYTALELARQGGTVLITARNADRLAESAAWIKARAPGATIETETVDFASLASVRALAARILARHPRIDILVNNAGAAMSSRTVTADGLESTFQVNHLAPFLLTNLLLPAIKAAAPARIVTVASAAHLPARIDFDDLQLKTGWKMMRAYGRSKLANIMFTYALARRLEGSGVTATCVHPGFVATRMGNKGGITDIVWWVIKQLAISPQKGAQTSVYAAIAPEMAGVSGQYLVRKAATRSNEQSYNVEAGERLWHVSADLANVAA